MKMKIGKAADSLASSMQLSSRLYWLLWGANGGDDKPRDITSKIVVKVFREFLQKNITFMSL